MGKEKETSLRVLMSPFLGYGHISPFLQLAKKLSKTNFYIYICSTPVNLDFIRPKLSSFDLLSIELVELHLPSSPELPPHYHTTNGLPLHLHPNLYKAFKLSQPNFMTILKTTKPHLVLYDGFQSWVPDMAASLNIPAVYFHISSAVSTSFLYSFIDISSGGSAYPFPAIYFRPAEIKKMMAAAPVDPNAEDPVLPCIDKSNGYILTKTCHDIEGKYLDYLSVQTKKKVLPVGLLIDLKRIDEVELETDEYQLKMMKWLNSKQESSTVFVSFGSETFLSEKEMEELAFGLEMSGVNFIWFIRFPGSENMKIEELLPKGFVDRVKGRGMVLEGWAPQAKILGHPSIGGYFSHCGWSSVMESLSFGVPIIGLPMKSDQPLNCRLLVELGACLEIESNDILEFKREEVERVIKVVVNGESVRKKAKELSEIIRMNEDKVTSAAVEELKKMCTQSLE